MAILPARIQYCDLWNFDLSEWRFVEHELLFCHALCDDFSGVIQQRLSLGHGIHALLHHGIGFDGYPPAVVDTESRDVHLTLQSLLKPFMIQCEFGFGELETVL